MKFHRPARTLVVAAALGAVALVVPNGAAAVDSGRNSPSSPEPGVADFEGRTIDLKRGWGDAQACHVNEELQTTCYRSEQEMDDRLGVNARSGGDYPSAANGYANCGSSLKLYWNNYYGTPVLYLTVRQSWTTLSWFGSDNVTSSYKVGSCYSTFRSGSYGGGSTYPGPTYAWARRSTMGYGWWDNALSSVYIS